MSAPWFLAVLALVIMLGTQFAAFKIYWDELFPKSHEVLVIKRDDPSPLNWSFSSDEIVRLREELEKRLAEVENREGELAEFDARLQADREEIETIKENVELMRQTLMEDIVRLEDAESRNLRNLAKTYAELEPEAAVSIFNELDDDTVVKIMFFMKPETVGLILQEMATQQGQQGLVKRAAKLSDMLRLFKDETQNA